MINQGAEDGQAQQTNKPFDACIFILKRSDAEWGCVDNLIQTAMNWYSKRTSHFYISVFHSEATCLIEAAQILMQDFVWMAVFPMRMSAFAECYLTSKRKTWSNRTDRIQKSERLSRIYPQHQRFTGKRMICKVWI